MFLASLGDPLTMDELLVRLTMFTHYPKQVNIWTTTIHIDVYH
jgi:hypothetical protein